MNIQLKNENFILHSTGAVFWEKQKTVIISDVHLGKVTHFRKHGIAIPQNAVSENFRKITAVLDHFLPEKIIFLGDLFHSTKNAEWNLFEEWLSNHKQETYLITGNHDIIDESHYKKIGVIVTEILEIDAFFFTHHPTEKEDLFNFSGHIHPGIVLRGLGLQTLKLRCFFCKPNQIILPAFGEFTGKYFLKPSSEDTVYAIAGNDVIQINKE
ncbi:ligase-associated DNA damage response endonuclease PdeM [Flavobacterium quisquiliarum]|uniref:Ligase-associated DNA damage response endonuclease PdeM n=1 Tax=Flavobacterium quisquiliarum TaxID=1834436 RepID=A0ABV8W2W9_9FLAO|nr:ligase-associated DNA damage response endonuclease PdeM [Flavobacterium quisquiliarum]MBW1654327.1 ligase-associated DNA damage response endonuclease PdeM [Flavobacterium quisquiliarum]NWL03370.1 ligase-associated DNA damage response endonuclease PdeM [Flavobacterium collinsii]